MNRDELATRMADYLDGLFDEPEAREVEATIAKHPALFAEVAHARALIYRPYAVPPPRADQEERILARFRKRPFALELMRYAAVFVAGVLTTLALQMPMHASAASPEPGQPESRQETPPPPPSIGRRVLR